MMPDIVQHALRIARQPICLASGGGTSAADARLPHGVDFDHGLLRGAGAGRTDTLPINVHAGSYVLPADVVSGFGQGDTNSGAKTVLRIFHDMPRTPDPDSKGGRVPIIAAPGEIIIHPDYVRTIGGGAKKIKEGHESLDDLVRDVRKRTHETLKKLPGPAR